MKASIDAIVRESLTEFFGFICSRSWRGREREAISLYVTGYLIRRRARGSPLHDPTQIAIEGAVPQIGETGKKQVCKDLVFLARASDDLLGRGWETNKRPTGDHGVEGQSAETVEPRQRLAAEFLQR